MRLANSVKYTVTVPIYLNLLIGTYISLNEFWLITIKLTFLSIQYLGCIQIYAKLTAKEGL